MPTKSYTITANRGQYKLEIRTHRSVMDGLEDKLITDLELLTTGHLDLIFDRIEKEINT